MSQGVAVNAIDEGLRIEATQFAINVGSADLREGTAAFVEKRAPQWRDA